MQPLSEQPLVVAGEAAHTARRPQIMRVLQERNRVLSERRAHLASIYLSLEEAWLARVTRLEVRNPCRGLLRPSPRLTLFFVVPSLMQQRSRSASGPSRTSTPASQAGLVAGATAEQRAAADANMRRPGRGRGDLVHSEEEMNQILRNLQQEDLYVRARLHAHARMERRRWWSGGAGAGLAKGRAVLTLWIRPHARMPQGR